MGEISGSVGFKGKNHYKDVKIIQELLNKSAKSTPATAALKVDGYCGPKTINAIRNFQRQQLRLLHPDGRVDPAGKTIQKLNDVHPTKNQFAPHVVAFINQISEDAKKAGATWNVPVSVLIAQAAHESGWGRHVKGNAYFGIKGKSPRGNTINFSTKEVIGSKTISIKDSFRAYDDFAEAADDYGRFLNENPRYKNCLKHTKGPYEFVKKLADAGYATDPEYAQKVSNIIRKYELTKHDHQ